jgi:predicted MFS family arabinose efflux permease
MSSMSSAIALEQQGTIRPLIAGALLFTIGPAAILMMPMIVGVYIEEIGFSIREAGFLASIEAAGMAISSILGMFWVKRLNWQHVTLFGVLLSVLANIAACGVEGFLPMLFCRLLASLGAGTAFAVSVASLGEQPQPERAYGIGLVVQTALMVLVLALSAHIIEMWGLDGLFFTLVVLSIAVGLPVVWLPKQSEKNQQTSRIESANKVTNSRPIMLVLLATVIHFIGTVAFWAYFERIGDTAGHSTALIGTALALALGAGMLGAGMAAWLSDRFGFATPFIVSTAMLVISVALAVGEINASLLIFCAVLFDFMWVFANAYQVALVARLDISGSLVVLVPAAQGAGGMAGPALAALFIQGNNYLPVNILSGVCFILSLFLFLAVLPELNKSKAS